MPGHMNVLLAEADVPYDQLLEMDDINPRMETATLLSLSVRTLLTLLRVKLSLRQFMACRLSMLRTRGHLCVEAFNGVGFAGIENPLFYKDNARMLFGDAKESIGGLVRNSRKANTSQRRCLQRLFLSCVYALS